MSCFLSFLLIHILCQQKYCLQYDRGFLLGVSLSPCSSDKCNSRTSGRNVSCTTVAFISPAAWAPVSHGECRNALLATLPGSPGPRYLDKAGFGDRLLGVRGGADSTSTSSLLDLMGATPLVSDRGRRCRKSNRILYNRDKETQVLPFSH